MDEPAQPDAFAAARFAHHVHAVVPVAGAHQRQAVRAGGKAEIEAACAMFEQRGGLVGLAGLEVEVMLAVPQRRDLLDRGDRRPARHPQDPVRVRRGSRADPRLGPQQPVDATVEVATSTAFCT